MLSESFPQFYYSRTGIINQVLSFLIHTLIFILRFDKKDILLYNKDYQTLKNGGRI